MIGINKGPIALDLETIFLRKTLGAQPRPLGKGAIVAVVVQNTFNNMDLTITANNIVVMIGGDRVQPYLMLPGQESPLIYASDLEQIYGRVQSGVTEVDVTLFVYKERKPKL